MIKKAQTPMKRRFLSVLVGLFALLSQIASPNNASAFSEDMATAFDACMDQYHLTADPDTDGATRDQQSEEFIGCVKNIGFALGELQVLCTDDKYQDLESVERCDAALGRRVKTDPESRGERQAGAVDPVNNKCVSNNRAVAWFGCPLIDNVSNSITRIYGSIVEQWLVFDPVILQRDLSNPTSNAVYKVWSSVRLYANLIFLIILIIMILSEITGSGNGVYSIKKLLPKIALTVVLVNLSYYICQIAVDICNIAGSYIGKFFTDMSERIDLSDVGSLAGGISGGTGVIIALVLAIIAGIIAFLAMGPAFLIPVLLAIVGAILSILFTFAMLVVRQALMILMVIVSPVAIAFSALPNTESIFKKWLNLSRGLLLTYPIASLLFYGGNYASRLILKVWEDDSIIISIVALVVCVLPITMLPKVTQSSIAAIDRTFARFQNRVSNFAGRRITDNRFADKANEIKREKANRRAAGVRLDKKSGELKQLSVFGKKLPRTRSMDYNLPMAERGLDRERHIDYMNNNKAQETAQLENQAAINAAELQLDAMGPQSVQDMERQLLNSMGDSNTGKAGDLGMTGALAARLYQSEEGRNALRRVMRSTSVMGNAAAQESMRSICSGIAKYGDEGENYDPAMMGYARENIGKPTNQIGDYSSYTPSQNIYKNISGEKLQKMDTEALRSLHGQVSAMRTSGNPSDVALANNIAQSAKRARTSMDINGVSAERRLIIDQLKGM